MKAIASGCTCDMNLLKRDPLQSVILQQLGEILEYSVSRGNARLYIVKGDGLDDVNGIHTSSSHEHKDCTTLSCQP